MTNSNTLQAMRYDLNLVEGESFSQGWRWKLDGAPVDLTDWDLVGAITNVRPDGTILLDLAEYLSMDDDQVANRGVFYLDLSGAQTALIGQDGVWDIFAVTADEEDTITRKRLLFGEVHFAFASTPVTAI